MNKYLLLSVLSIFLFALSFTAGAQGLKNITFPVAELGNCGNQSECKSYCDGPANVKACVSFAEKNGMITAAEAARARQFEDVVASGGPGGCKDQGSCESYCNDINNLESCLGFAEKYNLIPKEVLKEAKAVQKYIKEGGKMPGSCNSKNTCETYCNDSNNIEECLGFAEKSGFVSPEEAEQARKVLPLIKSGESPGQCKTKDECENYCSNKKNAIECVTFAEKAGFMSKEEADLVRKTGGVGPNGCSSKDECSAFCNDGANQEACFQFAKEHDIIPVDKLKVIEEGMGRMRAGLSQSPKEVIDCLKDNFGPNVIGEIESGKFMPGPEMGAKIKDCFEKNMGKMIEQLKGALEQATPDTVACLEKELGAGGLDKIIAGEAPKPEQGDVFRKCFENMRTEGMKKFQEGIGQMPPEARACIEGEIGKDKVQAIENGEDVEFGPEIGNVMQKCGKEIENSMLKLMEDSLSQVPPEIRDCIKGKINDDMLAKLKSGKAGPEVITSLVTACMANFKPNIPTDYKPGNIPEGFNPNNIPNGDDFKIPTGGYGPSSGSIPSGVSAGSIPSIDCSTFAMVPSCSYVPEVARSMCEKCKGQ